MDTIIGNKVKITVTLKVEIVKDSKVCIQSKTTIEVKPDELTAAFKWLADKAIDSIKSKPGFTIKNKARTLCIVETDYLGRKNKNVSGFRFSETANAFKEIAREYNALVNAGTSIIVPAGASLDNPVILEK